LINSTSPPRIYTGPQRDGSETAARQQHNSCGILYES
jgi:hypothetical protein